MGGLTRQPFDGAEPTRRRPCVPPPPGVRLLDNAAICPGAKLLAKGGWWVKTLRLLDPTEGYDFDTIIVSPDDYVAMREAQIRQG